VICEVTWDGRARVNGWRDHYLTYALTADFRNLHSKTLYSSAGVGTCVNACITSHPLFLKDDVYILPDTIL
jgi:hypothetical protein